MVGWRKIKAGNELMLLVKAHLRNMSFEAKSLSLEGFFLGRGLYVLHDIALGLFIAWCGCWAKTFSLNFCSALSVGASRP